MRVNNEICKWYSVCPDGTLWHLKYNHGSYERAQEETEKMYGVHYKTIRLPNWYIHLDGLPVFSR